MWKEGQLFVCVDDAFHEWDLAKEVLVVRMLEQIVVSVRLWWEMHIR